MWIVFVFFFFQAEDGIRDVAVTGVQTCALPIYGKATVTGKVGKDLSTQQAYQVAREVGLILLATVRAHLGSLDRVRRIVKVLGMVASAEGFGEQPQVINGFSDLMVEVFGEAIGKHARSAVGLAELPRGIPVEIEIIMEVE